MAVDLTNILLLLLLLFGPHSNTWRCTYLTGVGCTGNLESTHNEIHNILGGTQGEMA
jgi:hypothetical protein